jgi:hypothetical protein
MTRRERLTNTLNGNPVDRPPVSFYELNGFDEGRDNPDPFNIFSHSSWKPLIDLTREKTDKIVTRGAPFLFNDPVAELSQVETFIRDESRFTIQKININGKTLTCQTRHDKDVFTVWTEEHLLKNVDDLKTYLQVPMPEHKGISDISHIFETEKHLGDTGIVLLDTADPLCLAAALFDMAEYTIIALTEQKLFRQLLDRFAAIILPGVEAVAKALPGHLW